MALTPTRHVAIPPALLDAARRALDLGPEVTTAHVLRLALAQAAGEDVTRHTPKRTGRPPRKAA